MALKTLAPPVPGTMGHPVDRYSQDLARVPSVAA